MNKINVLILFFISSISLSTFSQKSLILSLPFNNNVDDIRNHNNGKTHGNITYGEDRNGKPCSAIYFDGQSFVTIPNSNTFNSIKNEFSVTSWFKIEKATDDYLWITLVCKGDLPNETNSNPHFRVQVLQTNTQSTVSVNTEFTEYDTDYLNHRFNPNKWMFFALTYDGNNVTTYLDGKKTWEFPYSGNLYMNNSPLFIGKDIPGATEFFKGYLDDFKLFNKALSEKDILKIYKEKTLIAQQNNPIECIDNTIVNTEPGKCGAKVNYLTNYKTNCGIITTKLLKGLPSGSFFETGKNDIVYKVKNNGNTKICRFNIYVKDNENPKIICPDDYTVTVKSDNDTVFFKLPKVSDNCNIKTLRENEYGGKFLPTTFPHTCITTFEVTDINGNINHCSNNVTIIKKNKLKPKPQKADTINIIPEKKDTIIYKEDYKFKTKYVIAEIYDDMKEDNDTISVFFNDIEIVHYRKVRKRGKNTIILNLDLSTKKRNNIVIKAWNLGEIPPNTVRIDFYETDSPKDKKIRRKHARFSKTLHSKPGLSSAIWLNYKK